MSTVQAVIHRPTVLIAGGGVAALEALMALRSRVGGSVGIEMLAPSAEFSYRPTAVAEPFGLGEVRRFELAAIARDHDAHVRHGALADVEPTAQSVWTTSGERISYDFLVVATGAQQVPAIAGASTFTGSAQQDGVPRVLDDIKSGTVTRLAFVVPPRITWALPLYEIALFTAAWASERDLDQLRLLLVTDEARPLEAFGERVSDAMAQLLRDAGVELVTSTVARTFERGRLRLAGVGSIAADAAIALPALEGPFLPGLPHDEHGFVLTDRHGAVRGLHRIYAAGDSTSFPIKQGGLAAQQADAVADAIAAELGVLSHPEPFTPVLRGLLLGAAEPRYLRAPGGAEGGGSQFAFRPLWWPPAKIAGKHLAPYLAQAYEPALMREPFEDRALESGSAWEENEQAQEHEAMELLLELADANARRGSFTFALRCLQAAEDVGGPLPASRQADRHAWELGRVRQV